MCKHFSVLAALLLASSALTTVTASAQHRGGGGAPAAPHMSAAPAAPHFSAAPAAPHFSAAPAAPHFSAAPHISAAPHFSAAPRFSAPAHVAGPRFAPHVASHGAPSFAHRTAPSFAHRTAPSFAHGNAARTAHAPSFTRHASTPSTTGTTHNNTIRNTANRPGQHTTVGAAPATTNGSAALASRHTGNNRTGNNRILRNSALTNLAARDPAARSLASSTFRGNFAQSRFARGWDRDHHHHHFGFVLGFVGPLFWPYAYDDFVDYTFWPDAYDTFWPYAYDDVFEGLYGAYAPEYGAEYAYAGAPASSRAYQNGAATARGAATQVCSGETQGLTNFPIEQIARQVQPNQQQQALLDQLKSATEKAVGIMQAACPNDLPATPTGRLAAMHQRVEAMLQAVQTVRPALEKFYDSLTDEQKERFNALDENAFGNAPQPDVAQLCGQHSPNTGLSTARINQSLRLTSSQEAALKALNDASAQAAQILSADCPTGQTLTPPGRVAAMEQRLKGMLQAIETVRPALSRFYASLSDEQKARFDRLGRQQPT
jgi:hypothetical protein